MAGNSSISAEVEYDAGFRGPSAVNELSLEGPVSSAMSRQDTIRYRRTREKPRMHLIGVRDEWVRGNEDTDVPPCPQAGLRGAVRG